MSDYKEIETQIELTQKETLMAALDAICNGIMIEENAIATNKWSHNRQMAITMRQANLPDYLQGYGDIGFELKNGKYVPIGISQADSHYVDRAKGLEEGTFANIMNGFFGEVENAYALIDTATQVMAKGVNIGPVQRIDDQEDPNALGMRLEIEDAVLARLGVNLPVS
jgi:hypothetical protein